MIWYRILMLAITTVFVEIIYSIFKDFDITDPIYGFFAVIGFIVFAIGTIRRNEGE